MGILNRIRRKWNKRDSAQSFVGFLRSDDAYDMLCSHGYISLDKCPEVVTACRKIAVLISSMTIHLMKNTDNGDQRIVNELSRKIDINPYQYMTRRSWMEFIVMQMLLYGKGNSVVRVHMVKGEKDDWLLGDLEPLPVHRYSFMNDVNGYRIWIDGRIYGPDEVLHFTENPDPDYPWLGRGTTIILKDLANNLKQAAATEKGFLESKWKPSIIVKVDAINEELSTPEGRRIILEDYVASNQAGEPWILPAQEFQIEQVRPLSLQDLALKDTIELDRRMVAAILGVPPFVLGVGDYKREAWNAFITDVVAPIAKNIEQEMTRKMILSPQMYLKFNIRSLMDWDIKTISDVLGGLSDRGIVTGNEVRDAIGMSPLEGLDELRILENYIPADKAGDQKKLAGAGGSNDE